MLKRLDERMVFFRRAFCVASDSTRERDFFTRSADFLPRHSICHICRNANKCKAKEPNLVRCRKGSAAGEVGFRIDGKRFGDAIKEFQAAIDKFKASFKRVAPWQIEVTSTRVIKFTPKPKAERRANGRDGARERISNVPEWRKWCENCGEAFTTVNPERTLCDGCSHEIVERLGWANPINRRIFGRED